MKLFFAAPASALPFLSTAFAAQMSALTFFQEAGLGCARQRLPLLPIALLSHVAS
jgi:hypothetical protein